METSAGPRNAGSRNCQTPAAFSANPGGAPSENNVQHLNDFQMRARAKRLNMRNEKQTGVILFAHGSRIEEANAGVRELARQVGNAGGLAYVRAAFLEMAEPRLSAAIEQAVREGMRQLIIIPYFLTMGVHLRVDLPALISEEQTRYTGLEIHVGEPLEGHPLMPSLILGRIHDVNAKYKPGS